MPQASVTVPAIRSVSKSSRIFVLTAPEKGNQQLSEADGIARSFNLNEKSRILGQPIPYAELTIGVMKETFAGENRVSQTPDSVQSLIKAGFQVVVQEGGKSVSSFNRSSGCIEAKGQSNCNSLFGSQFSRRKSELFRCRICGSRSRCPQGRHDL